MAKQSRAEAALAEVDLFSSCTRKELHRISHVADRVSVGPGEEVISQGDTAHECYVVVDGSAVVRRNGRKIATIGAGEAFGELALFDSGPRTASVISESDLELLVIGQKAFWALLEDVPTISRKLLRHLAEMLRRTDQRMYG